MGANVVSVATFTGNPQNMMGRHELGEVPRAKVAIRALQLIAGVDGGAEEQCDAVDKVVRCEAGVDDRLVVRFCS